MLRAMNNLTTCRLCLKTCPKDLNVFGERLIAKNVKEKILKYLFLNMKEGDILKCICVICLEKIEDIHIYCEEVRKNQFKYQQCQFTKLAEINNSELISIPSESLNLQQVSDDNLILEVKLEMDSEMQNEEKLTGCFNKCKMQEIKHEYSSTDSEETDNESSAAFDLDNEKEQFKNDCTNETEFPKIMIKDDRLAVRGKELIKLMSRFYKLNCNICSGDSDSEIFTWLPSLIAHYTDAHTTKGYVICCGNKLVKLRNMALHMAKHLQPDAFQCQECGKMLTSPRILRYHIQNHLPEGKRPLACPNCSRRFSYSSALNAHQISHLPEEQRDSHICDECGKKFLSTGSLIKHINLAHSSNAQKFVCHECGKQFGSKGNLTYHLTTHEEIHQVQCDMCKKWLKNKLCLRKHMTQHSNIRHNCPKCNYSAINRQCLNNHIKVQHSNDKPYKCENCDRRFKLKNTLINHMVQHTGIKKYTCEFCTRLFASSGNYYTHRKRMHPTELAEFNKKKEDEQRAQRELALEKKRIEGHTRRFI